MGKRISPDRKEEPMYLAIAVETKQHPQHRQDGGVRSGMTYLNAQTIAEINQNARFIEMTSSGMMESKPHGMTL